LGNAAERKSIIVSFQKAIRQLSENFGLPRERAPGFRQGNGCQEIIVYGILKGLA